MIKSKFANMTAFIIINPLLMFAIRQGILCSSLVMCAMDYKAYSLLVGANNVLITLF